MACEADCWKWLPRDGVLKACHEQLDMWHKYAAILLSYFILCTPSEDSQPAHEDDSTLSFRMWLAFTLILLFIIQQQGSSGSAISQLEEMQRHNSHKSNRVSPQESSAQTNGDWDAASMAKYQYVKTSAWFLDGAQKCIMLLALLASADSRYYDGQLIIASFIMGLVFLVGLAFSNIESEKFRFGLVVATALMHSAHRFFHFLSFHQAWDGRTGLACGVTGAGKLSHCGRLFSLIFIFDGFVCSFACIGEVLAACARQFCPRRHASRYTK